MDTAYAQINTNYLKYHASDCTSAKHLTQRHDLLKLLPHD